MRGKASAKFIFDAEPERSLRARLRKVKQERLEALEDILTASESENKEILSIHSEHSDSEAETMAAPVERLLGDYGGANAPAGQMTIVNQPVDVAHFQLHPATIRQLEKKPFSGRINEDANKHLQRFLTMTTSLKIEGHSEEAKKLVMFPFTLSDDAEEWFYSLPAGSITTWQQMETTFLNEYFPASVYIRKRYDIVNFKQKEGESLGDAYKRFKRLLVACPTHNMDVTEQMQNFVNGLKLKTKQLIDTAVGGSTNFKTATEIKKIIDAIAANEHLELYDRSVNQPEGLVDLKLTNQVVKMEEQIAAEVERRMKQMALEKQTVAQVQPVQPIQAVNCEICGGPHFAVHCVATAQQVEEINFLKQNNPYSNTYNPGWKNHPNFSWKDQQGNVPKQGAAPYQGIPQQQQQYRPPQQQPYQQPYQQPQQQFQQQGQRKADWEIAIEKMAAHSSQFQEETRSNFRNTGASIKNLEIQMSQIAQQLAIPQQPGALPSATVTNPKDHNNVSAIITRSGKAKEVVEEIAKEGEPLLEVDVEIKENEAQVEDLGVLEP